MDDSECHCDEQQSATLFNFGQTLSEVFGATTGPKYMLKRKKESYGYLDCSYCLSLLKELPQGHKTLELLTAVVCIQN